MLSSYSENAENELDRADSTVIDGEAELDDVKRSTRCAGSERDGLEFVDPKLEYESLRESDGRDIIVWIFKKE